MAETVNTGEKRKTQLVLEVGGVDAQLEVPLLGLLEEPGEEEGVGMDRVDQFTLHLRLHHVGQGVQHLRYFLRRVCLLH